MAWLWLHCSRRWPVRSSEWFSVDLSSALKRSRTWRLRWTSSSNTKTSSLSTFVRFHTLIILFSIYFLIHSAILVSVPLPFDFLLIVKLFSIFISTGKVCQMFHTHFVSPNAKYSFTVHYSLSSLCLLSCTGRTLLCSLAKGNPALLSWMTPTPWQNNTIQYFCLSFKIQYLRECESICLLLFEFWFGEGIRVAQSESPNGRFTEQWALFVLLSAARLALQLNARGEVKSEVWYS